MANSPMECAMNGSSQPADAAAEADDSVLIRLEVQQAVTSAAPPEQISERVRQLLSSRRLQYRDSVIPFSAEDDSVLAENVVCIRIVDTETDQEAPQGTHLLFWQVQSHCLLVINCSHSLIIVLQVIVAMCPKPSLTCAGAS